jgi:hypothetical protein
LASQENISQRIKKRRLTMATKKKYVVVINEVSGTLDKELFKKMASKGDITSVSVTELVEQEITVTGTASATIETDEKTFKMSYFNTEEYGIVHCGGGTLFEETLFDYLSDGVSKFRVNSVKCKMGTGYKAVPVLE